MNETSLSLLSRLRSPDSDDWNQLVEIYTPLLRLWLRKYDVQNSDTNYCQLSWPEAESGGVFLQGSVDEKLSLDDECDLFVASESSPFL